MPAQTRPDESIGTARGAAEHIAAAAGRLRDLADAHKLAFLAYLIDMAAVEARRIANEPPDRPVPG